MLELHPVLQGVLTLVAVAALVTGMMRLRKPRANDPLRFRRKLHMRIGKIATIGLILGAFGGYAVTYIMFGDVFLTGLHGQAGIFTAFFLAVGLATGIMMERNPGEHPNMPRTHGMITVVALAFCLFQLRTGLQLWKVIAEAAQKQAG